MSISVFDMFKVGIGPSSSHTVGPMRAAHSFAYALEQEGLPAETDRVHVELFGSLGATGHGHGSVKAVVLGLEGETPELVDPAVTEPTMDRVHATRSLRLLGKHTVVLRPDDDVVLHRGKRPAFHANAMTFEAAARDGRRLASRTYYSVGGGFVVDETEAAGPRTVPDRTPVRHPFTTGAELLAHTRATGLPISSVMMANELSWRSEEEVRAGLLHIWSVMRECVRQGCANDGVLPGGLKVRRRAAALHRRLPAGRSPRRGWPCTATAPTTSPSTRPSRPCGRPEPT